MRSFVELTRPQLELIAEVMQSYMHMVRHEISESCDQHPTLPQDEIDYYENVRILRNDIANAVGFELDDMDWNEFSDDSESIDDNDGSLSWEQAKSIGK